MMTTPDELSASMEDYLEAIFHIVADKQAARAKDIAQSLGVNNSSVTGALRSLSEKGYINYAPYDVITLTPKGQRQAEDVVRRHEALMDFFTKVLCVEEAEASEAACKMEHAVSRPILDRLIRFVEFIEICPRGGDSLISGFRTHCSGNDSLDRCHKSIANCLADLRKKQQALQADAQPPLSLTELAAGDRGQIVQITGAGGISQKLADLRITPGCVLEVLQADRETGSLDIKVRGYRLHLSLEQAARIVVDPC
jgi:DtxR family Mn-dependent transcriptional regulator